MADPVVAVETIGFRAAEPETGLPLLDDDQVPVPEPEWDARVNQTSKAAYKASTKRSLAIDVVFTCSDPHIQSVEVRAFRTRTAPECIGDVASMVISFDGNQLCAVRLTMDLSRAESVEFDHVFWQWQYRPDSESQWVCTTTSEHEFAFTLGSPAKPWTDDPTANPLQTAPWWDVLRRASLIARGHRTESATTTSIAEAVNSKWGGSYFVWDDGKGPFTTRLGGDEPGFDLAKFLRLLNNKPAPQVVDCSDIAAIVSTFSAILGCKIRQFSFFNRLNCRPVRLVGHPNWALGQVFGIHEIAVSGDVEQHPNVRRRTRDGTPGTGPESQPLLIWDACLEVSRAAPIGTNDRPNAAKLPVGISERPYLRRLLIDYGTTLYEHKGDGPDVRPLRPLPDKAEVRVLENHEIEIAKRYQLSPDVPSSLLPGFEQVDLSASLPTKWMRVPEPGARPTAKRDVERISIARTLWQLDRDSSALMAVDLYLCPDALQARRQLIVLLSRFVAGLVQVPLPVPPWPDDVFFQTTDGMATVSTFKNAVLYVRSVGRSVTVGPEQVREVVNSVGLVLI